MGLYNKPGQGCKPTFNSAQKQKIIEWTLQEPRQLKEVVRKVKEEWKIEISTKTIKRILKALSMSWHRMRRGIRGEPNPDEYKEKQAQLEELKRLEELEKIDLYYLDKRDFV